MSVDGPWLRLSARVIWVDLLQTLLALAPGVVAVLFTGAKVTSFSPWTFIAVVGVGGAVADMLRWTFTRYRVTDDEVQRRSGVFVRTYRSVRRDRIRSVDSHAKLRHRIAGLRVVTVGAGQQTSAGQAAFVLDALTKADAVALRAALLHEHTEPAATPQGTDLSQADAESDAPAETQPGSAAHIARTEPPETGAERADVLVLARFRPWWVVYNIFSVWAYVMAGGLLWGAYWFTADFGLDLVGTAADLFGWGERGTAARTLIGLAAVSVVGAVGMAVAFFTGNWGFELARVRGAAGMTLRTRRGLFTTREVGRDEARTRGITISEPLLWRWTGMADTNVITTGLGLWSMEEPTRILPRGPVSAARAVSTTVVGLDPLGVDLPRHPRAALRRRLWWATWPVAGALVVLAWPLHTGVVPVAVLWGVLALLPVSLLLGLAAYRALGHSIEGDYLVARSGLLSRSTSALRRDAVSTIVLRESVLQRRLGLTTVSAMTAAGYGTYPVPDLDAREAVAFASAAAPGLLDPFLEPDDARSLEGTEHPELASRRENPDRLRAGGSRARA
ncbi:PH domain-containing protein [Actinocorallia sp. A-T 12471]|uniref:PH domain-containing protein n=1 Tax=Actinocorallia sp. A-T 12471 TaxID=3089813 RepID=UPI0029CE1589|nr:PH domain-containing protein [Actinocorallia sp. A-T 12471]MDX6740767.1 PH domain-containing protein [Actinocorallia sp. A-T 12471]